MRPSDLALLKRPFGAFLLSAALGAALLPQSASAQWFSRYGGYTHSSGPRYIDPPNEPVPVAPPVRRAPNRSTKYDKDANKFGTLTGPLAMVVSIAKQRVTLFADGKPVAEAPVSTGTFGHETPMGIFAVIAKSRFHESNIYSGAPMPYMQRITWSGIALHEGPLPGHAASHGCIRLPGSFASGLFKVTRLGARVIVTRDPVAPVEFANARLFVPRKTDEKPVDVPVSAMPPVVVADAQSTASIKTDEPKGDLAKSDAAKPVTEPHGGLGAPAVIARLDDKPMSSIAQPVMPEVKKRKGPVQVFVSRKTGRLYVRQNFQPLFDAPVTIAEPDKPWGTHIFTAMTIKDSAVRWTAITIPSGYAPKAEAKGKDKDKRDVKKPSAREMARRDKLIADLANAPAAGVALERFEMPKDAVDRISELLGQGSSLIVSDNALSNETGLETDFVVETP